MQMLLWAYNLIKNSTTRSLRMSGFTKYDVQF